MRQIDERKEVGLRVWLPLGEEKKVGRVMSYIHSPLKLRKKIAKLLVKSFPLNRVRVSAVRAEGYAVGKQVYIGEDFLVIDDLERDVCSLSIGNRVAISQ
jgi:hypothetical protein